MELVEEECALCIIGAGYAGISALYAAKSYLKPNERIIVVDKLSDWGGQWLKQYDFVRLHQPYQHFTAGNRRWSLNKPPTYLASKDEVLNHLQEKNLRHMYSLYLKFLQNLCIESFPYDELNTI